MLLIVGSIFSSKKAATKFEFCDPLHFQKCQIKHFFHFQPLMWEDLLFFFDLCGVKLNIFVDFGLFV